MIIQDLPKPPKVTRGLLRSCPGYLEATKGLFRLLGGPPKAYLGA